MQIFRGLPKTKDFIACALTIGNFDGVHLGHKALLTKLCETARAHSLLSCILTFEPHPREFFSQNHSLPRINQLRDKLLAFDILGIDRVIIARFDAKFAVQSAIDFIRDVIVSTLCAKYVIVGENFSFGAQGLGNFSLLQNSSWQYGFQAKSIPNLQQNNIKISSSNIRKALQNGDLRLAKNLLGHPYSISGRVAHGEKIGRTLGIPTLNLYVFKNNYRNKKTQSNHVVLSGVFIVMVHGLTQASLPAVASLGTRPTIIDNGQFVLETHILDFTKNVHEQDLYGRLVTIEFLHKLRNEIKYQDLESLHKAMLVDIKQAKDWFKKL